MNRTKAMNRRTLILTVVCCVTTASAIGCKPEAPLPSMGQVPPFEFSDQAGQQVGNQRFMGQPWVAAFMFTRCPTICPGITREMRKLQVEAQSKRLEVHWVSFSVDPEHDTPKVLDGYAKKYDADTNNWSFLTGDFSAIQQTAEKGFKIGVSGAADDSEPHYGISHGSHLVLVDSKGTIRGYYRTTDEQAQQRLLKDLAGL